MTLYDARDILHEYNLWRTSQPPYDEVGARFPASPRQITQALSIAEAAIENQIDLESLKDFTK